MVVDPPCLRLRTANFLNFVPFQKLKFAAEKLNNSHII